MRHRPFALSNLPQGAPAAPAKRTELLMLFYIRAKRMSPFSRRSRLFLERPSSFFDGTNSPTERRSPMPNAGQKQEERLFKYLRYKRHCIEVIEGDQIVRTFLGMRGTPKCADAIGVHQP